MNFTMPSGAWGSYDFKKQLFKWEVKTDQCQMILKLRILFSTMNCIIVQFTNESVMMIKLSSLRCSMYTNSVAHEL